VPAPRWSSQSNYLGAAIFQAGLDHNRQAKTCLAEPEHTLYTSETRILLLCAEF